MSFFTVCMCVGYCVQAQKKEQKDFVKDIVNWQNELNKEYKTRATSPLSTTDFVTFTGHQFFDIDTAFIVNAKIVLSKDKTEIPFKTTTTKIQIHTKYADVYFSIKGQKCKLSIYQAKDLMKIKAYEDYLFLPFIDATSGEETYGGGRYIDLRLPKPGAKTIAIDFNKAYNPYCAYAAGYSCPKVPSENELKLKVLAGVKYNPKH
jgi:uncharacterized protein